MNSTIKLILQGLATGVVAMAVGAIAIKAIKPSQPIKPMLIPLFVTGLVLFGIIEVTGLHKKFCIDYLKP